jgi:hypothetical protein
VVRHGMRVPKPRRNLRFGEIMPPNVEDVF